jgi:hypothetical protein
MSKKGTMKPSLSASQSPMAGAIALAVFIPSQRMPGTAAETTGDHTVPLSL